MIIYSRLNNISWKQLKNRYISWFDGIFQKEKKKCDDIYFNIHLRSKAKRESSSFSFAISVRYANELVTPQAFCERFFCQTFLTGMFDTVICYSKYKIVFQLLAMVTFKWSVEMVFFRESVFENRIFAKEFFCEKIEKKKKNTGCIFIHESKVCVIIFWLSFLVSQEARALFYITKLKQQMSWQSIS